MPRKTVTITTPDHPAPRQFHLEAEKAERFAARIRTEGGTAEIGPFVLGKDMIGMLCRIGVNPTAIR